MWGKLNPCNCTRIQSELPYVRLDNQILIAATRSEFIYEEYNVGPKSLEMQIIITFAVQRKIPCNPRKNVSKDVKHFQEAGRS